MRIDASLARGLRSNVLRDLVERNAAVDVCALKALLRKTTAPTTLKGERKLLQLLNGIFSRNAILPCDKLLSDHYGTWMVWQIMRGGTTDWPKDLLIPSLTELDMRCPADSKGHWFENISFSMHLIERAFQRLNTMTSTQVLDELAPAARAAFVVKMFAGFSVGQHAAGVRPLMLPTEHGAVAGDLHHDAKGGIEIRFRTFMEGGDNLSPAKRRLLEALNAWRDRFARIDPVVMAFAVAPIRREPRDEGVRQSLLYARALIREYFQILDAHPSAMGNCEDRRTWQSERNALWASARAAQAVALHA